MKFEWAMDLGGTKPNYNQNIKAAAESKIYCSCPLSEKYGPLD